MMPATAAADCRGIGKSDGSCVACHVLMNGKEARNAAADRVFASHKVARPFRSDHENIDIRGRHDLLKMDGKPM